jgi:hypothetical protein
MSTPREVSTSREVPPETPRTKRKPSEEPIVLDEEDDDDQFNIEGDDDEEMEMGGDPFENYLLNEEGENIADILTTVSKHMEMQNKILIKILTILSKK